MWVSGADYLASNGMGTARLVELGHHSISTPATGTIKAIKSLNSTFLIAIGFFIVCGGPVGSQGAIAAAGPLIGLSALFLFPIFYGIPICYLSTELSVAFPEDGGYALWTALAFGPFWGLQVGYWAWISNCINCAIYPSLLVSTIVDAIQLTPTAFTIYVSRATAAIVLALPTFFGVKVIGRISSLLAITVLIPFMIMTVWCGIEASDWSILTEIRHANTTEAEDGSSAALVGPTAINWHALLYTVYWNYIGFHKLAVFAGEVENPKRTFPRVMGLLLVLVTACYLIPNTMFVVYNEPHWTTWDEATLLKIAKGLGGSIFSNIIGFVCLLSLSGLFMCSIFQCSFLAYGMAESGLAPPSMQYRSVKHGTPHGATFASLAIILIIVALEFEDMIGLSNALCAFTEIAILLAGLKLRYSMPDVKRPIQMPLWGLGMIVFPSLVLLVYIAVMAFFDWMAAVLVGVFLVTGFIYGHTTEFHNFKPDRVSYT